MIHDAANEINEMSQRAGVYAFLGQLWTSEIDRELLRRFVEDPEIRDAFRHAGGDLTEIDARTIGVEELAEDFCQLFLGPANHLPPYQSVWIDGRFAGDDCVTMKQWCELVNFEPNSVDADQFGIQLSVMSRLVHAENLAMESEFFHQHLMWASPLIAAVSERARTHFYKSIAKITAAFLNVEHEHLAVGAR